MWRALAVLRVVLLGFAVAVNLTQWRGYAHPVLAWGVVGSLAVWSLVAVWFYATPRRRYRVVLAARRRRCALVASTPDTERRPEHVDVAAAVSGIVGAGVGGGTRRCGRLAEPADPADSAT